MAYDKASSHNRDQGHDIILDLSGTTPDGPNNGALGSERASSAPQPVPAEPAGFPFRFIDEFERQNSKEVKREVRAHVRRETHLKQRKLNEASKPKPLSSGRRRILQKIQETPSPLSLQSSSGVDQRQKVEHLLPMANSTLHPPTALENTRHDSDDTEEVPQMDAESQSYASVSFPLSRWQSGNTTPYALLLDDNVPFLQLGAATWPFPQPIRGNGPAISVWMPQKSIPVPDAKSPRPCLLRSSQTVPWIANSVDYLSFKHNVIQWVNRKLLVPDDATSDMTIGVLICLMSWEIARANVQELKLHMDGLFRIISLRGGEPNITSFEHFCWKVGLIDLLVAVLTSSEPRLCFRYQEEILLAPTVNRSLGRLQIPDSPLHGNDPFEFVLAGSAFCEDAVLLVQFMSDMTRGTWREDSPLVKPEVEQDWNNPSNTLSRIVYATSSIYRKAFEDPPIPFSSPSNTDALATICRCLEDTRNDETWTEYPGILLWIVLTAMAAAVNQPQCSFFAMFVFRVGTSAAWWGPRDARMAIMNFLRVKRRSEGLH